MNLRVTLVALLTTTVALAGCTAGDADGPGDLDPDSNQLQADKGAIEGLLIDDRYRPVPDGKILLQELGLTTTSNANGEFSFVDIAPGTYTLRVTVDGHEAAPSSVDVLVGEWTEAHVVARRILDAGSFIYTQQFTVFQFCGLNAVLVLTDVCNLMDLSGDSGRAAIDVDLRDLENVTYVVSEFRSDNPGNYDFWVGHDMANFEDLDAVEYFAQSYINGDYLKCVKQLGEVSDCYDRGEPNPLLGETNVLSPLNLNHTLEYVIFVNGEGDDETNGLTFGLSTGVGGQLAFKAKVLISAFIGEPENDVETYCVLCKDA